MIFLKTLDNFDLNSKVIITDLSASSLLKDRLLSLGFTENTIVEIIRKGPSNNLTVYLIRGTMIALRKEEASTIFAREV
ncbi:FeoA family protein [Clostridium fallax]|uniref:Ferrous iron transport protein A n=1 Tax=Clostridium fallax TaxID=1533 RepID=A0A1M4TW68_9CLOT|nr:FeoA family protein [Clostridium fallax]SHE48725.1 ferrous iron transport protein A [Clostridium fallax]SQB22360.1 Fe2+ transport system protein A [Clostridium fallax]